MRERRLPPAKCRKGSCRLKVVAKLDTLDIAWDLVVETESDRTVEVTVSADLAIQTMIEGTEPPHLVQMDQGGNLPDLPVQKVSLYGAEATGSHIVAELAGFLRQAFDSVSTPLAASQWHAA